MSEPTHPDPTPAATPGAPVDDRRDDPPAPASTTTGSGDPGTEGRREAEETVRSISRLEESN
jgi:hypothetical protein